MRSIIILLCLATTLVSCGEYQKVLKETDIGRKYTMADSLFNAGKYRKSLRLYEQIVPVYRGKPEAERLQFLYATNFYHLKDYYDASYNYERFAISYPKSDSAEVAAYRSVESFYNLAQAKKYTLDTQDTETALEKIQVFLTEYSDSAYQDDANALSAELQTKLQRKDFEIAKQYLRIMDYKAAIASFTLFVNKYSGSEFQEEAYLRRTEAAYLLAKNSVPTLVQERLEAAKEFHREYLKYYKDAEFSEEAEELLEKIEKDLIKEEITS
ncbi:MAG TPA: outer membrane protein assembly factor BamD [Flavobacteriaceae bacterium]|nr:outer membrane protein assembly factor BamD [Flavobacteriaceae bacterium]